MSRSPGREPVPCGTPDNVLAGREPTQLGWYRWIANCIINDDKEDITVLDVGSGCGEGIKEMRSVFQMLRKQVEVVYGFENDPRLISEDTSIGDIAVIPPRSFDYVTCVDVIEHVYEDIEFMDCLKRIADRGLFVTTPNYMRSKAANHHHAREYTIPEFVNAFEPDRVFGGSPDGYHHHTELLRKTVDGYERVDQRPQKYNSYKIPPLDDYYAWSDGQNWAHFCAVWEYK